MRFNDFSIKWSKVAEKQLLKLPPVDQEKILEKISLLSVNSEQLDIKKLHDIKDGYRMRHGNYRIIYQAIKTEKVLHILFIAPRKDAYKFLNILTIFLIV